MVIGNISLQELARAHVASLLTRPGLRRVVEVALRAAGEALPGSTGGTRASAATPVKKTPPPAAEAD